MKDVVYRAVSVSVNGAVDDEVCWVVNAALYNALYNALCWAKDWAVHTDSGHPALQEFLHSCRAEMETT